MFPDYRKYSVNTSLAPTTGEGLLPSLGWTTKKVHTPANHFSTFVISKDTFHSYPVPSSCMSLLCTCYFPTAIQKCLYLGGDMTRWHLDRVLETLLGHMLQKRQGMVNLRSAQKGACLPKSSLEAEDKGVNHHTKLGKLGGISGKSATPRGFLLEKRHWKSTIFNSLNTLTFLPPLSALLPSLHYHQFGRWFQVQCLILPFIVGTTHQRRRVCLSWLTKCFRLLQAKI